MWLITNFGFFSVVEKSGDKTAGRLTVRARVKADLETLRARYLPELGEITANAGTDYKYRAPVARSALAQAVSRIVEEIDYSNFKNSVAKTQGHDRSHVYSQVWDVLYQLQEPQKKTKSTATGPKVSNCSYSGILFDEQGRVLLREPAGHFDGYVWTFPKGRAEAGEAEVDVALREVLEETGYRAQVIRRIPQVFQGGTSDNVYFVMCALPDPGPFDKQETASIRWVHPTEARDLIGKTTNAVGRKRDLAVLDAAIEIFTQTNLE